MLTDVKVFHLKDSGVEDGGFNSSGGQILTGKRMVYITLGQDFYDIPRATHIEAFIHVTAGEVQGIVKEK